MKSIVISHLILAVVTITAAGCSSSGSESLPLVDARGTGGSSASGGGSNIPAIPAIPAGPTNAPTNLLCASLANPDSDVVIGCANPGSGLKGDIYVLENGYAGPEIQISYIMNQGVRLSQQIQMTNFDVPTRSFTEGFPLSDGTLLSGPSGRPVTEWFAFDLEGYFTLRPPYAAGLYQFAFFIDDGAILKIDGQEVLNADGYHSPQWKCQTGGINLNVDEKRDLSLQYFQGPAHEIALRMMIRPYNPTGSCDANGGFIPVPNYFISN